LKIYVIAEIDFLNERSEFRKSSSAILLIRRRMVMRLSFKQREGLEELPRALKKEEFPDSLRIAIWNLLYEHISPKKNSCITGYGICRFSTSDLWTKIIGARYESYRHKRLDLYTLKVGYEDLEEIYTNGNLQDIYNDLDFIISLNSRDLKFFRERLKDILDHYQCYYTIFFEGKNSSIAPRVTEQEKNSIEQCYKDLDKNKFDGAKTHLVKAVKFLNKNNFSDSVRESISAVESVCRLIAEKPKADLTDALKEIKKKMYIHEALEKGFKILYGYTSDEKGIVDAQYMIGSCASFISYLINKANNCGLLKKEK